MKTITIEIAEIHDDAKCPNVVYWKIYRWYKFLGFPVFRKLFGVYDSFDYMDSIVTNLMKIYHVNVL